MSDTNHTQTLFERTKENSEIPTSPGPNSNNGQQQTQNSQEQMDCKKENCVHVRTKQEEFNKGLQQTQSLQEHIACKKENCVYVRTKQNEFNSTHHTQTFCKVDEFQNLLVNPKKRKGNSKKKYKGSNFSQPTIKTTEAVTQNTTEAVTQKTTQPVTQKTKPKAKSREPRVGEAAGGVHVDMVKKLDLNRGSHVKKYLEESQWESCDQCYGGEDGQDDSDFSDLELMINPPYRYVYNLEKDTSHTTSLSSEKRRHSPTLDAPVSKRYMY